IRDAKTSAGEHCCRLLGQTYSRNDIMAERLLDVQNLRTHFFTRGGVVKAVEDVSFTLDEAETLGIVGESGCGKSVTALSIMRLIVPPGKIVGGKMNFQGTDI